MKDQIKYLLILLAFLVIGSVGVVRAQEDNNIDTDPGEGQDILNTTEDVETDDVTPTPVDDDDDDVRDMDTTDDEVPEAAPQTGFGTL